MFRIKQIMMVGILGLAFVLVTATVFAIAAAFGTMGTTPGAIQIAHAQSGPQTPHGTCGIGGLSGEGAFGCAGNVGGFIVAPNGACHTTAGKFNIFSCPP